MARPRRASPRRVSEAEKIASVAVPYVLAESTRIAIEKMATDIAQKMLADETFQAELRAIVKRVAEAAARSLRSEAGTATA